MNGGFPSLLPRDRLRGPVLALAAHPDDEVIGCGAMLAFHALRGDPVLVVHATDASGGDPVGRYPDIAGVRAEEGRRALQTLGVTRVERWGLPDGGLAQTVERLAGLVEELFAREAPGTLYTFSPLEFHPDHRAVAEAALAAAGRLPAATRCLLFGVNHPALPGVLMDTTDLIGRKREALACFESQLAYNDFAAKAVHRDHAATLNVEFRGIQHAEAFTELRPGDMAEFARLVLPLRAFLDSRRPVQ